MKELEDLQNKQIGSKRNLQNKQTNKIVHTSHINQNSKHMKHERLRAAKENIK